MILKDTFILKLTYEMSVDTETGEVLETKLLDRTVDKPVVKRTKKVIDDSPEPKLILEDNKYRLTNAAVELMELEAGAKMLIRYENNKPVIGEAEAFGVSGGNKLSKSNTVICKGVANEQLSKYGTEFIISPREDSITLFDLISQNPPEVIKDDRIEFEDGITDDLEFDGLEDITEEVDNSIFDFKL